MTSPSSDNKAMSEDSTDINNQENVSARSHASKSSSKQQIRHRASVACASCRDRRIRCVVPRGETECTQCKRSGNECIIKNDDERRRPISKAYMSSLSDRISMLEAMLLDKGVVPPLAVHPPKTRQEAQGKQQDDQPKPPELLQQNPPATPENSPPREVHSPPESGNEDFNMHERDYTDSIMAPSHTFQPLMKEPLSFRNLDPKRENIVHRLLSTKGNLSFDQLSGRLRFFGPTANSHVYAECADSFDSREPPEQVRRSERIIRSLTVTTHDYLMNCYWNHYNSIIQVIDQAAFEADRESQNPKFYSSFLHITILAMGYRFADQDREDMRKISLGNRESTLQREAKYMLDIELERPGGIPSVQALLLLGDLECGVGRDNTGWMYSGMANRLAFDIGLHLDCRSDDVPESEVHIRHMVMKAAVIIDKYWALFLGRPTSIKSQDIGMDLLTKRFSLLSSAPGSGGGSETKKIGKASNAEIYEYLIELMELAGKIVETRDNNKVSSSADQNNIFALNESEENAYLHVISLDRQLQNWYRRLPDHLTWKPANIKAAPMSYFLLHQQYHVSMILLHRPWAKYGAISSSSDGASTNSHPSPESTGNHHHHQQRRDSTASHTHHPNHPLSMAGHGMGLGDPQSIVDDSRTSLSRSICTQQAIRVARIFWQHRQRFDGRRICVTGIQHAGTAAIALIAALAYQSNEADRRSYLGYLEILSGALTDMSHTYQPASRMDDLLKVVLDQLRSDIYGYYARDMVAPAAVPFSINGNGSAGSNGTGGWQHASPDNIYSVLPARRENPDGGDCVQAFKKRRPTPSRRASEFARQPPPFFAQPTPPGSSGGQGYGLGDHGHSHGQTMGGGGMFDGYNHFGLDFLGGPPIDLDERNEHGSGGRNAEDYVLVTPSSDGWALNGMNGDHVHGGGYDMPIGDWMTGPAGLSASSVLNKGHGVEVNGKCGEASGGAAEENAAGNVANLSSSVDSRGRGAQGKVAGINNNGNGEMEWMGSEGGLNALSPVSLSGLVHSVEKVAGGEVNAAAERNHELDFFSF